MKKTLILAATLISMTSFSYAQESFVPKSNPEQDAPMNMVCKLKNGQLNTCLDVSGLNHSKMVAKRATTPKATEVYRVRQSNGNWSYSDVQTADSEVLDLTSERMTSRLSIIK